MQNAPSRLVLIQSGGWSDWAKNYNAYVRSVRHIAIAMN